MNEVLASLAMLHHQRLSDLVRCFPHMKPMKFDEGPRRRWASFPAQSFFDGCANEFRTRLAEDFGNSIGSSLERGVDLRLIFAPGFSNVGLAAA